MKNPEFYQERISRLNHYIEKLKEKIKPTPNIDGYYVSDIDNALNKKAKKYMIQYTLFSPNEREVYENYKGQKYVYSTTKTRHTAKELGISERQVKLMVKRYERGQRRHERYLIRNKFENRIDEVVILKKEYEKANRNNALIYRKINRLHGIQEKLANKRDSAKVELGLDCYVLINFKGLAGTSFNGELSGSLDYLSQFITKEELDIAIVNDRVKVLSGDLEKVNYIVNFRKDKIKNNYCSKCKGSIVYNIIGFNKKIGRSKDWLCVDCLGVDFEYYLNTVSNYKRTGCNLFV